MIPRFRVSPTPGTDADTGPWRTLSMVVENDGIPHATPLIVASFILPAELADELQRQVALLNDVLDLEESRA